MFKSIPESCNDSISNPSIVLLYVELVAILLSAIIYAFFSASDK